MREVQQQLEKLKISREVDDYDESHEFRLGYVKAMCHAINLIKDSEFVTQHSELVCLCKGTTQVNRINGRYICCSCNSPII